MSIESIQRFYHQHAARIKRGFMVIATVLIYSMLAYQLSKIGWREVVSSVPRTPWFYVFFIPLYFLLPLTELLIYRKIFAIPYRTLFMGLLRKRVVNKDVMGYAGEVYFTFWVSKASQTPFRRTAGIIKDNALGSLLAVSTWTLIVLNIIVTGGGLSLVSDVQISTLQLAVLNIGFVVLLALLYKSKLSRLVLTLSRQRFAFITAVHLARLVLIASLQIIQWKVTVAGVPLDAWMLFLGLQILISRIPILPSRDIIFVGIGIQLMQLMSIPVLAVTSMLVTASVLDKGLNLILFVIGTILPDPPRPENLELDIPEE
jgi:hypothetical protein